MNLRHSFLAVVAATSLVGVSAPAQAASFLGVPENTTPGTAISGASPKASFPYFNSSFVGDGSTYSFSVVEPAGLGSRGRAQSAFGVFTGSVGAGTFTSLLGEVKGYDAGSGAKSNDWLGTCNGGTIAPCTASFTFAKGVSYTLGLLTQGTGASAYGVSQADSYTFRKVSDQFASPSITVSDAGSVFLGFEDGDFKKGGSSYWHDYQDWVVKADVVESVPEPASLAGLAMVAGGLITARRRKAAGSAKA
jgi:hypothetical protein